MYQYCISRSVPTLFLIVETKDLSWLERRTQSPQKMLRLILIRHKLMVQLRLAAYGKVSSVLLLDAPETWTPLYVTFSLNRCSGIDPFSSPLSIPKRPQHPTARTVPSGFLASPALSQFPTVDLPICLSVLLWPWKALWEFLSNIYPYLTWPTYSSPPNRVWAPRWTFRLSCLARSPKHISVRNWIPVFLWVFISASWHS